ncbi:hypothetical protein M2G82_21570 [Vibrio vulnificus]|nr:hypothetical protein [Vibrio vulnificus]
MKDKSKLMLVVRTSYGGNKATQKLVESGPLTMQDKSGKEISFELAHYQFIGDTHIRFVFDSECSMENATAEEFKSFNLSPNEAVDIAIKNIYRDYGEPNLYQLEQGIYQIQGNSPDFDSSYFLDAPLWENLEIHFNSSIVVAVPSRNLLLLAPSSDKKSVVFLEENVKKWFIASDTQGVSSALYLYKNEAWSVYQAPMEDQ